MLTYLMMLRIPEWKELSKKQRHFVWEHCVHPLLTSTLAQSLKSLLLLLAVSAALWFGPVERLASLVVIMAAVFIPCELVELVFAVRNRQRICTFIQSHAIES